MPGYVDIGLTDDEVEVIVEEMIRAYQVRRSTSVNLRGGRPSRNGKPTPSPHVGFRVSPELREQADHLARRQGIILSQLAREALEHYVAGN
ncbi:MAG: hypothetical protein RL134_731 [Actinomycetota bacterium]